ncbi:MAG: agmatine deiminase family protein [Desulfuromonadaceae bacterium]|nr:agmatine deiminase family protein [Desulfuromonadaceae bacterium]MDD5105809.1 agmatine deiminase family protein [Desulfuromonadaceae bacterium]
MKLRLPAEWEIQDGVMMAWPHEGTDWNYLLDDARSVYADIICAVSRFERVLLVAVDAESVVEYLHKAGADMKNITVCVASYNDTWTRDYGPVTVQFNNSPVMLDFGFNGWGLKYPANYDNLVSKQLKQQGMFQPKLNTVGFILEGGSIESDGLGTILTTAECLLSPNRNPQLDKSEIEQALTSLLGTQRVLWLNHGYLAGDDTDSHVDTLARICPDNTIVYQACNNPVDEHFAELMEMKRELEEFTAPDGSPYRLLPLPWPKARFDEQAHRLPATYANFLIINGAVLVPTYDDHENDQTALEHISQAFPGREIIGINCLPLLDQHGSLHCVTMQLPQGVLP